MYDYLGWQEVGGCNHFFDPEDNIVTGPAGIVSFRLQDRVVPELAFGAVSEPAFRHPGHAHLTQLSRTRPSFK